MPSLSEALVIAVEHHRAGRLAMAEEIYRRIVAADPEHSDALNLLGVVAQQLGRAQEALGYLDRAVALQPEVASYYTNRGEVCRAMGDTTGAIACYRRAVQLDPNCVEALNNLGACLHGQGFSTEAIDHLQRAVQLRPEHAGAHNNLGVALRREGRLDSAIRSLGRAVELDPSLLDTRSTLLSLLHYRDGMTLESLAAAHADYGKCLAPLQATWQTHQNLPDPERRLRVGFVSSDLGQHPVGYFLLPVLEHLDRRQCEVFCYCDRPTPDEVTAQLQAAACEWRATANRPHAELAEQIRGDRIDILFDLAGHTAGNRLLVFARRPAPIQITWLGYVGTTGLAAMDCLLADRHHVPPAAEPFYGERVLRMPDSYACFAPPLDAPLPGPLPAGIAGRPTFGCFNSPDKITPQAVTAWAEILGRVPESRLMLKHFGFDRPAVRLAIQQAFATCGVAANRVQCHGSSPRAGLLAAYQQIDVALDTFPYSGGLTTCEALWMGVPVVTWPGATFASRHALSYLTTVGMTETIADNRDHYIELAVRLAVDRPRLAAMRDALRPQMAASPLCDGRRFAHDLLAVLRTAWRGWCLKSS